MGRRRQAREFALQTLYLSDVARLDIADAYAIVSSTSSLDAKSQLFARELLNGAATHRPEIDERIVAIAQNWALDRMAAVDRNLLRLASYELLYCPETPVNVIIDEALEIGKVFSSSDSSKFLNGILDKIKEHRTPKNPAA